MSRIAKICKNCEWWRIKGLSPSFKKGGKRYGTCETIPTCEKREIEPEDMAVVYDDDGLSDPVPVLVTREDFGCVKFERKYKL